MTEIVLRDMEIGDLGWLIWRHGEYYRDAEGFDASFEVLVGEILVDFAKNRGPKDRAFIAARGAERLGSVFCVQRNETDAQLRLFYLEEASRGLGLGKKLLSACIDHARAQGFHKLTLWTHESHEAACALYARFGFDMVGQKPVRSFGMELVEQSWEKDLTT